MRRIPLFLFTVCIVALLALLFYSICVPRDESSVRAKNGVLDLSGQDFDKMLFPLRGDWEFYYGSLLYPEDFERGGMIPSYKRVPSSWSVYGYPRYGFATYRLVLQIGENRVLAMSIPDVTQAARVFINGKEVFTRGIVGETNASYQAGIAIGFVFFQTENNQAEIIVQAANYNTPDSGMISTFRVGDARFYFMRTMDVWLPATLVMGCITMMGLYHLILWLFHKRSGINLAFSLLCFTCIGRFLFETDSLGNFFLPDRYGALFFNVYVALFALHMCMITVFSLLAFASAIWKKVRWNLILYYVVTLSAALLFPTGLPGEYKYHVFTAPTLFAMIAAAKPVITRGKNITVLYYIGLALYLVAGSYASLFLVPPLFVPNLIIDLFMVLSQSVILSFDHARAQVEMLEARASEQKLAADNAALDRLNRMKGELMANISHETRTPLAVLSGYAELIAIELRRKGVDEQTAKDLDQIADETQRIAAIMSEMHSFTRDKENAIHSSRLPLADIIKPCARLYKPILERQNVSLTVALPDCLPPVFANASELTQVMFNLLQNAKNHTENGSVTISAAMEEGAVAVRVTDTGAGIPADMLGMVFKRGVSGDEDGTGLGLPLCREIINALGGEINIDSEASKGTTVRFTVPITG